ncbi:aa3-type cytochrome c oxidase subunit IV [Phenylobacterium sp.]|uniref:aa3-type cytochrome c oxidase subunit IV n=1 Tax=Phenylobacterium sp. TaxID=1871053 RepID=UPI0027362432|nr:aa3-type cytochrome c oxidase subunit IV [Phenylobacterium sp.]MDP3659770.1 aa3-type cytochrome c oxidase subunit IV [Phenylobacterium sp.]
MAEQASDYHHGEQDIHQQVSTFHLFVGMTKWGSLYLAALLLLLTIWFCTDAGFIAGLITAVVVSALGFLVLRDKGDSAH